MDFTIEKLIDNVEEVGDLTRLHYKESAPYDDIPLSVNWTKLFRLEEAGVLKSYFIRHRGKIVGYALFFIAPSIEYQTSLQASLSNIFLHPDYRGLTGTKFISWCDNQLKLLGVQVVYHHVKARNDYGLLLNRLGYVKMNVEYSKRLD